MTRKLTCTVTNSTAYDFYIDTINVWNGSYKKSGGLNPQSIQAGAAGTTIFAYENDGDTSGVTGKIIYKLDDNISLQLSFNNPWNQQFNYEFQDMYCYCFFYAGVLGVNSEHLSPYKVTISVTADGKTYSTREQDEIITLSAAITIKNIH